MVRATGVRYIRRLTPSEADVLTVAAEMVRNAPDDDLGDQMRGWAMRLKASHDVLVRSLRIEGGEGGHDDDNG